MKRPPVSESNFLAHLFHPKTVAQPTGLRKAKLKGARGTVRRRVNAYNKLSAVQQELLKRSGTRDTYLKGESNLADAKRSLRGTAVRLGLASPVRGSQKPVTAVTARRTALDALIANHLVTTLRDSGVNVNQQTVDTEILYLDAPSKDMLRWDYGHIKYAGRKGSEYERWDGSRTHNPFWYH